MVVHVVGHVEVHAADGLHDRADGLPLHDHLIVRLKADELGDLLIERLDALIAPAVVVVDGVDLLHIPRDVHHRVARDGHDRRLLVRHVVAREQHRVGVAASARVAAEHKDRVEILAFPLAVHARAHAVAVIQIDVGLTGVLRVAVPVRQLRRTDLQQIAADGDHADEQHRRQRGDEQSFGVGENALDLLPRLVAVLVEGRVHTGAQLVELFRFEVKVVVRFPLSLHLSFLSDNHVPPGC